MQRTCKSFALSYASFAGAWRRYVMLYRVWRGLEHVESFKAFVKSARLVYPGLVTTADPNDPRVWWVHCYAPQSFRVRPRQIKTLMIAAAVLGCGWLAINASDNPRWAHRVAHWAGFEQVDDHTWAIKLHC